MKRIFRFLTAVILVAGVVALIALTRLAGALSDDVTQLEAELGRMSIDDEAKIHIVAIEDPEVPPEVASNIDLIYQFRCYLPAGYDFLNMRGGGRVTDQGVYLGGGYSAGWSSPDPEPSHVLLTISLSRKAKKIDCFVSFGNSIGTSSWSQLSTSDVNFEDLVIETLATPHGLSQTFTQETILPLLRVYDPDTAKENQVAGQSLTTYEGGLIVLCPKSRQAELELLRKGVQPQGFNDSWIAEGKRQ